MRHKRNIYVLTTLCCAWLFLATHQVEALVARPADTENPAVRPMLSPTQDRANEMAPMRRPIETSAEAREPIEIPPASTSPEARKAPAEFTQKLEEHRNSFAKKIQERIYNLTQNIIGRMNAAVFRLSNIADRIDSRAQKMKMAGTDVTEVEAEINAARADLEKVRAALSLNLNSFIYGDRPKEHFSWIKTTFSESRANLMQARKSLERALVLLKNNGKRPTTGTTTTTSEPAS